MQKAGHRALHEWIDIFDDWFLGTVEIAQHIVDGIALGRTADANAQAGKAGRAQFGYDRIDAFVPAAASTRSQTYPPESEIEVVMNDQDPLHGYSVSLGDPCDGSSAVIHKCERLGHEDAPDPDSAFPEQGFEAPPPEAYPMSIGEVVNALESDVVAVSGVLLSGIAEAHNKIEGSRR